MDGLGDQLNFIAASAGTGKTYKLVETVFEHVSGGTARAEGVVATTFSNAAANELKERLASRFHQAGLHDEAARLDEGLIGTVHGICLRLLQRFAFEAGLSPELRILDESESRMLLDRALDDCVDEARQLELCRLGDRLEQRDREGGYQWRRSIFNIITAARINNLAPADLARMGTESWNELAGALPPETGEDLEALLRTRIDAALAAIPEADKPKNSAEYRQALRSFLRSAEHGRVRWSDWASLGGKRPAKEFHPLAEAVAEVTDRISEHAPFRADVRGYLEQLFTIAGRVAERFRELKRERGAVDFDDMEKDALDLLRGHESVREILREEIDLLLVDEFQDTSPMQLAVFTELGALAKQVVWVGDVKQSIYEFRGADPDLVFNAVRSANKADPLTVSWRSTPELVSLANQLFADVFDDYQEITAARDQPDLDHTLEIATIRSNESVVADVVQDLLARQEDLL